MHINCAGLGNPPVLLDSGLGDSYIEWQTVQPQIAKFVQVCSYDRAGMGYSQASPRPPPPACSPKSCITYSTQPVCNHLTSSSRISMAGFIIRLYAARYRPDVAGIVPMYSSHPDQFRRLPPDPPELTPNGFRKLNSPNSPRPSGFHGCSAIAVISAALRAAECTFDSARENAISAVHFARVLRKPAGQAILEIFRS
jgi:hypothetical protein